jgi:hypothetical protein
MKRKESGKMKRILSLFLSLAILAAFSIPVTVANANLTFSLNTVPAGPYKAGDSVEVQVIINRTGTSAIGAISYLLFEFDSRVFEWDYSGAYVRAEPANPGSGNMPFSGGIAGLPLNAPVVIYNNSTDSPGSQNFNASFDFDVNTQIGGFTGSTGTLLTIKLKVKADAPQGASPLTLSFGNQPGMMSAIFTAAATPILLVPGTAYSTAPVTTAPVIEEPSNNDTPNWGRVSVNDTNAPQNSDVMTMLAWFTDKSTPIIEANARVNDGVNLSNADVMIMIAWFTDKTVILDPFLAGRAFR